MGFAVRCIYAMSLPENKKHNYLGKDSCVLASIYLAKLGKNEPDSLEIIDKICTKLECIIQDVVEIKN